MDNMLDYIREQPSVLARIGTSDPLKDALRRLREGNYKDKPTVYLVGTGSSLNAAFAAYMRWESATNCKVKVCDPLDFSVRVKNKMVVSDSVVIGISQSGVSKVTVDAIREAKELGCYTLAVTSNVKASIAEVSHLCVDIGCGPENVGPKTKGYSATVMVLELMAQAWSKNTGTFSDVLDPMSESKRVALSLEKEAQIESLAESLKTAQYGFIVGSSSNYGTAREGSLKIMEIAKIPILAYELEDAMHGPFNALTDQAFVIVLNSGEEYAERLSGLSRILESVKARGCYICDGQVTSFDGKVPSVMKSGGRPANPVSDIVPVQLLAYHLARVRGVDPVKSTYDRRFVHSITKM